MKGCAADTYIKRNNQATATIGRSLGWRKGRNDVEMPKPNAGKILVKVLSTSLCHFHCLAFNLEPGMDNGVKVPTTT